MLDSNSCFPPSVEFVTGYPFTRYPRVFTFQDAGEQTPKGRKKGHGNSVKAVCHVLSMVLVLTKAGGCRLLSGFYTGINPACPAVELYAKRVNKNMKLLSQVDLESLFVYQEYNT